jgi:chromosome segregation ATPase
MKSIEGENLRYKEGLSQAHEECTSAQLELQQTKSALDQLRQTKEQELRLERDSATAKVVALERDLRTENTELKAIARKATEELSALTQTHTDVQRDMSTLLTRIARMEGEMK